MSTTREAAPYAPDFLAHLKVYTLQRMEAQLLARLEQVRAEMVMRNVEAANAKAKQRARRAHVDGQGASPRALLRHRSRPA